MKYFILSIFILLSSSIYADSFKDESEMEEYLEKFIQLMYEEKFKEGFDGAKAYWPIPEVEIDGIVNGIDQQWPLVRQRFGAPIGTEYIKTEKAGSSLIAYYYLHKFDKHAVFWKIDFYRPKEDWFINTIIFSDNLSVLYE